MLLFWRCHRSSSPLLAAARLRSHLALKPQANTTTVCTHKGVSSSHTWPPARCTNTEVTACEGSIGRTVLRLIFSPGFPLSLWRYWIFCQDVDAPWFRPLRPVQANLISHSRVGQSRVRSQWKLYANKNPPSLFINAPVAQGFTEVFKYVSRFKS